MKLGLVRTLPSSRSEITFFASLERICSFKGLLWTRTHLLQVILADIAQLSTSQCLLLVVFFKHSLYFTICVGLHTMSSPSLTIVNRVNRGFSMMNPSDCSATSSSSKFFQGFDRFFKKQGGKAQQHHHLLQQCRSVFHRSLINSLANLCVLLLLLSIAAVHFPMLIIQLLWRC